MGWSLKKAFKSVGKKVSSGVKSFTSNASSTVKSAVSKVGDFVSTAAKAQLKLVSDPSTIGNVFSGFASGGVSGGLASVVGSIAGTFAEEYDTSGEYNSEYEYKKYGFPSREEYELAVSYGYQDYNDWKVVKDLLGSNVTTTSVVTPASDVAKTEVDDTGNIVVTSGNTVEKTEKSSGIGGIVLGALALKTMGVI